MEYILVQYTARVKMLPVIKQNKTLLSRMTPSLWKNECLMTPQHKKQIGYWVSDTIIMPNKKIMSKKILLNILLKLFGNNS